MPFHVLEIINELFKQNGRKDIPDVKLVCSKAKINRHTALKWLYEWWEQYQGNESRIQLFSLPSTRSILEGNELQHAIISLQSLAKELEIRSDVLNHLPNNYSPLGNIILHTLQEIENKLLVTYSYMNQLNDDKKKMEEQLNQTLHENKRLGEELKEMHNNSSKKHELLQEQLDAKKREVLAANHLIKSLKREKRRPSLKSFFYDYNLIMNRNN